MKKSNFPAICAFILIIAASLSAPALDAFASGLPCVDFSDPGLDNAVSIPPSELLRMILGEGMVSDAEADYLDDFFEIAPLYSDAIPNSNITVRTADGKISVWAKEHSYVSAAATKVTWVPVSFEVRGVTSIPVDAEDGIYSAEFDESLISDGETSLVRVKYKSEIVIPAAFVNELLNFACNDAVRASEIRKTQGQALEIYIERLAEYKKYLADLDRYELNLAKYEEYLQDIEIHREEYALYLSYLAEKQKYDADIEASYNKYLADYVTIRPRLPNT